MTLRAKIKKLRALKPMIAQLEREILEEGFAKMQRPGEVLLAKPRIERVMEQFG